MTGIYKITNRLNGMCYIGQSVCVERRWAQHRYFGTHAPKNEGKHSLLHQAMRESGLEHFAFDVLEECSEETLTDRERFYIDKHHALWPEGYNQRIGQNVFRGRKGTFTDYSGRQLGGLLVLRRSEQNLGGKPAWVCKCTCGRTTVISSSALRQGQKSCGCQAGVRSCTYVPSILKHTNQNPLYRRWRGILYRCGSMSATGYSRYGARGIDVCPQWKDSYEAFAQWALQSGYSPDLEIDRIDNEKGYSPENCRWVSHKVNSRNRSARQSNRTGTPGVTWRVSRTGSGGSWRVSICVDGRNIHLGSFPEECLHDAQECRRKAEKRFWKEKS